jgi:ceramide glucosyltransferase
MIAAFLAALYLGLLLLKLALAWRRLRGAGAAASPVDLRSVCIAQPILSGDPGLAAALEDNVRALPGARFLWLVDTGDTEGLAIVTELRERHLASRMQICTYEAPPAGCNPKLHKLERARAEVREDVLVVLDDDTRLPPATAAALVRALDDHELATGLPGYRDDGRAPSRLLAQFVNDNAALTYLPLLAFFPPMTINGMAYALRTQYLATLGGFAPLLGHLTDDLAVAQHVLAAGGRIHQSAEVQWVQTTVRSFGHYVSLMHRWFLFALLLLRRQTVARQAAITVLNGLPPVLLLGTVAAVVVRPSALAGGVLAMLLVVRAAGLAALQRRLYGGVVRHSNLLSLVSELLQPLHLLHAAVWRRITWRTRRYRVYSDRDFRDAT